MFIKIKMKDGVILPNGRTDEWVDLYTYYDTSILKGEYAEIDLGVAMELPAGYEAIIAPRSSTFKRYGCLAANSIGIIDNRYKGDNDYWNFLVYATKDVFIPKQTKICQFRILKTQENFSFLLVDSLGNEDRGGIGSTGY